MTESGGTHVAPDRYLRGLALFSVVALLSLANFMVVLDVTIVNVAVPHIAGSLAVSPEESTWVVTSYSIAEAITVPLSGWLTIRFGPVHVFVGCVFCFGLCSIACGFAPTLPLLIFFRVLQGFSGGPLMPMSQTLLLQVTPPERAQVFLSIQMMTTVVAPIAGPVLGGAITDTFGWPWAFYINIPVAVGCGALVWYFLKSRELPRSKQPVDIIGLALLIVWIGALQVVLDKGQNEDWFGSSLIITLTITAVIGFLAFLIWELTDKHPIVDLTVFKNGTFSILLLTMILSLAPFFAFMVMLSLWLQTNMGYTATMAGYVLAFQGVLAVVASPIVGMLMSRVDPRALVSMGVMILAGTMYWRLHFDQSVTFGMLILPQLLTGLGVAMYIVPLMGLSLVVVPQAQAASAAGLANFVRTVSFAFGAAMAVTFWTRATVAARHGLTEILREPHSLVEKFQAHGLSPNQSLTMFDNMVQSQAVMLATNDIYLGVGAILVLVAVGVWFAPKPTMPLTVGAGGH